MKDLGGGSAEVTFFYGNPRASEVVVAGDFTDWQNGAWPMEKTEKGFTLTRTFKTTDVLRYKFISDGNWTTDLKAPEFVDDGFGGKNGQVTIADMIGGDDGGTGKAKINFLTWSMIGLQGNYLTQAVADPSKKGMDLDSVTVGFKSYNKFAGNFLPNCPVYIEIAMAETELDPIKYGGLGNSPKTLYQASNFDGADPDVSAKNGIKEFFSGILTNPVGYLADEKPNDGNKKKGYSPFLGHLKFGFNTPYINYYTGYIDAKTDVRQKVKWTTVGAWNGGYEHGGGFHVFSLGNKLSTILEEKTGVTFDVGFAPNRSADRKGNNYGYFGWAGITWNDLVVDFQTNGMYGDEYAFYDPIEHDFILGVKDKIGNITFAVQGLASTSQKKIENGLDFFGYSTDALYRSGEFDGIQNFAADAEIGYNDSLFGVNVEYRFRGAQANMLYVQQNYDDGVFTLSDQLGVLNSHNIDFNGYVSPIDMLRIDLGFSATLPLEHIKDESDLVKGWTSSNPLTWSPIIESEMAPLFGVKGGAELAIKPAVTLNITDGMTLGAYADMYVNCYDLDDYGKTFVGEDYGASDSKFLLKYAGLSFDMKLDSDAVKNVGIWYGLDNSDSERLFNTLTGQVEFKYGFKATLSLGLRTVKGTEAGEAYNKDLNNPFGFALGLSRQFKSLKKPIIYTQFVWNHDPFSLFGGGQDQLRMNRSNMTSVCDGNGIGRVTAINYYDGRAALRLGIRWEI
ncbi:MAG: glycogen-binding domain-containing protein [Treponemataceae bacterium]|nr:glycogen-binding domain-containing protein [Treponemataceae bacterium]